MPRASKKRSRVHKKPRLGPSPANAETTADNKTIPNASINLGRHFVEQKICPFVNLPVDIFLEIAAYCGPHDLLHLSRVSKRLRAVVLSKRNQTVWACARNNLDLPMPVCPEDMSEPKFVSLLFDPFCVSCGTTASTRIDYAARFRLCEWCWKKNVKTGYNIIREFETRFRRDRSLKRVIFDLVPTTNSYRYCITTREAFPQKPSLTFYQPEVVAVAKEYQAVVESSGGDMGVVEEYIKRRKARTFQRLRFHPMVANWGYDHARAQERARLQRVLNSLDRILTDIPREFRSTD